MEPRFGRDFSGVRVHTDATAAESAAAVQARAYTVGHNIVFGGKESASDLPILAHELVHVVQQSGTSPVIQRLAFCADFLELVQTWDPIEGLVRDSLAGDAGFFGEVEMELPLPEATAAGLRTERRPGEIAPYIGGDPGYADVALLTGSTLEILEVKKATWEWDGATFAEGQLEKYLRLANRNVDLVTATWRARGHPMDEITSVTAMPMTRLSLIPNPRVIGGDPVSLRWCNDGIIVYKVEQPEEEEPEEQEPEENEPDPSDTLPEELLKLGEVLAGGLAVAGLLGAALEIAGALGAIATSPWLAVAALVLGIVYFWDELKALGRKIATVASWVWGKITWILEKIVWLGTKLAEAIGWLAGKIEWLAEKIEWLAEKFAEGAEWVGDKIVAGVEWIGGEIASAAESVWDWLFGSGPQPIPPIIDLPVTEDTTHCAMVAHEDTIVKIGADVLFATDHSDLKDEADSVLKDAAKRVGSMLHDSNDRIMIHGYTDNVGTVEYNQGLSERRADAVADWFVRHGFPKSIIQTTGWGKTKAQYNDEVGRQKDRRVEIWVPKHGSVEKVCW
jgi:outer membrane protein OmpA-like peptidoglycan-associated protein